MNDSAACGEALAWTAKPSYKQRIMQRNKFSAATTALLVCLTGSTGTNYYGDVYMYSSVLDQ